MSWLDRVFGGPEAPTPSGVDQARMDAWEQALGSNKLPPFVTERLHEAAEGRRPWMATMTPAELLIARTHGMKPVATVSGTCWFHYGYSWTKGHSAGWHAAQERLRQEALACGANAVVDIRLRQIKLAVGDSMDFTLVGTAIKAEGVPRSPNPVLATVPALEFVRLLEAGIVPVSLAIGAHYEWLQPLQGRSVAAAGSWVNQPLAELGSFWEQVRRRAHAELKRDAARHGNGVLAHVQFGQLLQEELNGRKAYLGRHIVVGTAVDTRRVPVPHGIRSVVDMRDDLSPLNAERPGSHNVYQSNEEEGAI